MNFESHPGVPLKEHLKSVGQMCEEKINDIYMNDSDDKLKIVAKIIGLTHDFGKYHEHFQEYLKGKRNKNKKLTSHAPLSSLYTACVLKYKYNINDPFLIISAMLCVYFHHSNINKSLDDFVCEVRDIPSNYEQQIDSLIKNKDIISKELNELNLYGIEEFKTIITNQDIFNDLDKFVDDLYPLFDEETSPTSFSNLYKILLLFSILIDCDKKVAANIEEPKRNELPASEIIYEYINKFKSKELNKISELREQIRSKISNAIDDILNNGNINHILSINAPTGSGKTLLSLMVALKLRKKLRENTGKNYRIIYVLPYINIIEQTYKVFHDVLSLNNTNVDIDLLLKHHHLYYPDNKNNDEISNDEQLMLVESWDSEIIVTTFVQFMETLIGTRNRMLKKFHKLFNSIIILDEIQTTPIEYWRLFQEAVVALSNYSYIIFMTATKPCIFDECQYKELLNNAACYFKRLNRVQFKIDTNEINIDNAVNLIINKYKEVIDANKESLLVIVNTISTSIKVYNKLKDAFKNMNEDVICIENVESDNNIIIKGKSVIDNKYYTKIEEIDKPVLVYLSTNIIPKERFNRISLIKRLLADKKKVIVISTQLVEAGVDLDFDVVIRDIGPFDSIIQAAGRCNRNGYKDKGYVYIIQIKDEDKNELDANKTYGSSTIKITNETLDNKSEFDESQIFEMIDKYYKIVRDKLDPANNDESKCYIDSIKKLNFEDLSKFKLIKDENKTSVFIEIDDVAKNVLNKFRDLMDNDVKSRAEIRKARIKLEEYIVETFNKNVPAENISGNIDYIKCVSKEKVTDYYDYETGFKRESDEDETYVFY